MKTLDKYILNSFLYSLIMWFIVVMSLRIAVDLFLFMDEFTENIDRYTGRESAVWAIVKFVVQYYYYHGFVYFAQLGGIIIVAATGFTIWQLSRTNELTAMLASGVSLYRVAFPILICAIFLCSLVVFDREYIIPRIRSRLARDPDEVTSRKIIEINYVNDENNTLWYCGMFNPGKKLLRRPLITFRNSEFDYLCRIGSSAAYPGTFDGKGAWVAEDAFIVAPSWRRPQRNAEIYTRADPGTMLDKAGGGKSAGPGVKLTKVVRDPEFDMRIRAGELIPQRDESGTVTGGQLRDVRFEFLSTAKNESERMLAAIVSSRAKWIPGETDELSRWELKDGRMFIPSNMSAGDLELRASGEWIDYCSSSELTRMLRLGHTTDSEEVLFNKFQRMAEPFNNLIMLLIALPFLLSRERNIILSMGVVLLLVVIFFSFVYIVPYMGLGSFFSAFLPALGAGPISILLLDSVRT